MAFRRSLKRKRVDKLLRVVPTCIMTSRSSIAAGALGKSAGQALASRNQLEPSSHVAGRISTSRPGALAPRILGPFGVDSDLRRFGLRIIEQGGQRAKGKARIAVARKLAVLLHRLLLTGEVYEPLRNADQPTEEPSAA